MATRLRHPKSAVIAITSPAFADNRDIPARYAAVGENVPPALSWSALPENTQSLALICEDPDAPTPEPFLHWLLFNVAATTPGIPEGVARTEMPPQLPGASQGVNSFGNVGYDGPAPPRGHGIHRYQFQLFALDETLHLPSGVTAQAVRQAMTGHVLGKGVLVGLFSR